MVLPTEVVIAGSARQTCVDPADRPHGVAGGGGYTEDTGVVRI